MCTKKQPLVVIMNPLHDLHKFQLNNKPKNDDSLVVKKIK